MTEHHRKIELQSPDDLQYLISNVRRAANEKIDKDLPPIEGEDKMRRRVEALVQEYISTVFHTTSSNITINGMEPTPSMLDSMLSNSTSSNITIEEHEPFDARLWEKAKDLARQEEDLIEEIAALRRKMPGVAVNSFKEAFQAGMGEDERTLNGAVEGIRKRDTGAEWERTGGLGVGGMERQEDVEAAWRSGVKGLEGLKGSLPEFVAKAERAGKAEAYVLSKEKR